MAELNDYFKSIIDMDTASVVICNLEHTIIYINPAACKRYAKWGGISLLGKSLLDCHNAKSQMLIKEIVGWFQQSTHNNIVHTFFNEKENKDVYMVALRNAEQSLIGYYEKHEYRSRDTMKLYEGIQIE